MQINNKRKPKKPYKNCQRRRKKNPNGSQIYKMINLITYHIYKIT